MSTEHESRADAPLAGVRILITRSVRDGGPLRQQLEAVGGEVSHLPTIAVEQPDDWTPLDQALRHLADYHYVAFTSRNAVEAVFSRLQHAGLPVEIPQGPKVVAAGEVTARVLRDYGVETAVRPDRQTARGVAAAIVADEPGGKRVLYPTSDLAGARLRLDLEAAGAIVDQIVTYRTVVPPDSDSIVLDDLRSGRVDVVIVASPSAVRNLKDILQRDWSCLRLARIVCIGNTTARAVREEGLEPAAVASVPSVDGLVSAAVSLYQLEKIRDN